MPPEAEEIERLRRRIEELAARIEELAAEIRELRAPAPPPPPTAPEIYLPTPRAVEKIDPVTGERFISLDPDSLWWVMRALPFLPREYFECDEKRVHRDFGYPPLHRLLQEGLEGGVFPPTYAPWLHRCAETLKRARRERGL
jgi:hypothetical protein